MFNFLQTSQIPTNVRKNGMPQNQVIPTVRDGYHATTNEKAMPTNQRVGGSSPSQVTISKIKASRVFSRSLFRAKTPQKFL